jgi:hypothetical protein
VHEHFETFRAQAARLREGEDLPRFVEAEFRHFIRCTSLDVEEVLATVEARLRRLLERRGPGDRDVGASERDMWAEEAPGLA